MYKISIFGQLNVGSLTAAQFFSRVLGEGKGVIGVLM